MAPKLSWAGGQLSCRECTQHVGTALPAHSVPQPVGMGCCSFLGPGTLASSCAGALGCSGAAGCAPDKAQCQAKREHRMQPNLFSRLPWDPLLSKLEQAQSWLQPRVWHWLTAMGTPQAPETTRLPSSTQPCTQLPWEQPSLARTSSSLLQPGAPPAQLGHTQQCRDPHPPPKVQVLAGAALSVSPAVQLLQRGVPGGAGGAASEQL